MTHNLFRGSLSHFITAINVCIKLLYNNTLTGSQSGQQSADVNVLQTLGVAE